ncbi:MAG: DUF512 domain-containing protein [Firmicutes bacterium]|nr:DUF512 domain-containing protein [Bacillota bacterium]
MVEITAVDPGSVAEKAGITAGEKLISINGNEIIDVLDYRFYITEKTVVMKLLRDGAEREVKLKKPQYDDVGLEFSSFLMDEKRSCRNKCIFCFIDQNPHGMRESIYFKDDDTRLSFLMGNYVTLTNTSFEELDRIIKMHISPVNVSVHTTNPELRVKMLGNRFAGDIMEKLKYLANGGISLNCQIVLCKGVNDGDELVATVKELAALCPAVESIAVVPAGLTRHRKGLFPLISFTPEETAGVIRDIEKLQQEFLNRFDTRLVFAADEMYIRAGLELPSAEDYEGFPQLDNGIGLIRSMEDDVSALLEDLSAETEGRRIRVTLATGKAAEEFMRSTCARICSVLTRIDCTVVGVENEFFGPEVTVAGLLTGSDYYEALKNMDLGDALLIPAVSLRHERDKFLDDVTVESLSEKLGINIIPVEEGADIVYRFLGLLKDNQ